MSMSWEDEDQLDALEVAAAQCSQSFSSDESSNGIIEDMAAGK